LRTITLAVSRETLMARSFAIRGVVEGFYGTPWSHQARLDVVEFLATHGLNAYVYAPKDDAKHRADWRVHYDDDELARFRELASHCDRLGVAFGFAVSPGLDIAYDSEADRSILAAKIEPLVGAGVTWILLLLDDIPMSDGLAKRQGELATWLHEELRRFTPGSRVTLCPTEYVGTRPSPYLTELGSVLPPDVDIMWTGPTVCSPTITVDDATGWTKAVGDRRVIVWDNFPVNDALMTDSLHLGPYTGRDAELADIVAGVLCNPMIQPRLSQVPLATAMDFLTDPASYDAAASWHRAIDEVGGHRSDGLAVLCRACADSPVAPPGALDLAQRVDALEDELDGPGWISALADLAAELRAARALPSTFDATTDELDREVQPWAAAARRNADAGLAALRLLQSIRPVATIGDNASGRAAAADAERAMHAAFGLMFLWKGARADEKVVYGPRFAMYSPVVQLTDGRPALDVESAIREDANAIDRLCRLAFQDYGAWCREPDATVRVLVDGEERAVEPDGTFDAHGRTALLRAGSLVTRITAGDELPFDDVRLS
jgi:hyaluronoglucosaminidase